MNLGQDCSKDFLSGEKIYLNNASVSLMPTPSIQAMNEFLLDYNAIGPDSLDSDDFVNSNLRNTRTVISKIINCQPEEIVLTQSTTDGVNAVSNGLSFGENSNIIIRGESHEHHANYYPWLNLSKKVQIKNLKIDDNGFFDLHELESYLDENTKLVALSHALYNTGAILPIKEVGKILSEKNIPYFLDSAQTIGCIGNFDVKSVKCDFMAFNGSKWLCGPMGTGLFYCKKSSSDLLTPTDIGGESAMIYDNDKLAFKDVPERFQTGFRNYVGMKGLEVSANYLLKYGLQNIRDKVIALANQLRDGLSSMQDITIYGPTDEKDRTSIVSFNLKGFEPEEIVKKLEKQGIILAVREIITHKLVRASPHFFNTEDQIEKVIKAIRSL